jgi:hypothetical protein
MTMVTSYELVYFRFLTIRILPYKLIHNLSVQTHSSSTQPKEEAQDEEEDDGKKEDVVPDEASVGSIQCDDWSYVCLASLLRTTILNCD